MNDRQKTGSKARPETATHLDRYPGRLHDHLDAAADAAQAISAPQVVEADAGTPDELLARYGGNGEPQGGPIDE